MKTANFPRSVVEGRFQSFPFPVGSNDLLISITDAKGFDADVELPFAAILFLKFADTHHDFNDGISEQQAMQIAEFVKAAREAKQNVWVNCHMGMCRSGAVVSLLGELGWEIVAHPLSPARLPNTLVYNKVRKHFPEVTQSWDKPDTDIWLAASSEWFKPSDFSAAGKKLSDKKEYVGSLDRAMFAQGIAYIRVANPQMMVAVSLRKFPHLSAVAEGVQVSFTVDNNGAVLSVIVK